MKKSLRIALAVAALLALTPSISFAANFGPGPDPRASQSTR